MNCILVMLAATVLSLEKNGIDLKVECEETKIDVAGSVIIDVTLKTAPGVEAELPDFAPRTRGFLSSDVVEGDVERLADGSTVRRATWKLDPEPCAEVYKIAPTVVGNCWTGPIYFEAPDRREPVTGGYEAEIVRVRRPFGWWVIGWGAALLAAASLAAFALWFIMKTIARKVKEYRMSPVERAWVELDRLLRKALPERGRYKDFYVELTLVVRRYVQRQHGVKAPHLTTEEFFAATRNAADFPKETLDALVEFLEAADLVKFAGVEATGETASDATKRARAYIAEDDAYMKKTKAAEERK